MGLGDWINSTLHPVQMRYIPIIDAGVALRDGQDYEAYNDGVASDIFLKTQQGDDFVGQVWPGDAVYPDFFNPATSDWWDRWLSTFFETVPFDGVWEDMNEASNFCDGVCYES